jgi:hypothetical protein
MERARAIREKNLGADHPDVATSLGSQMIELATFEEYVLL